MMWTAQRSLLYAGLGPPCFTGSILRLANLLGVQSNMGVESVVEPTRRTVCVTGATGFVASWLVKRLLEKGYKVRATVRDPDNLERTSHLRELPGAPEGLELVKADLLTEGSFDEAVRGCEGVFHTATPVVRVRVDPKAELVDPAVEGTLNILRSCARTPSVRRIVMTSSSSAVRVNDTYTTGAILDESVWSSPELCEKHQIWYPLAKTLAEKAAWDFAKDHGLDLVVVLPSFIIGPVLPPDLSSTGADVLELLKGGTERFAVHNRMGLVHIDDVAAAHILVFEKAEAEGRYLCSYTVLENYELAQFLADRYPRLQIPTRFPNSIQVPAYHLNSGKLERLGLQFKDLGAMFDDMIASFNTKGLL